ncbi:hypothetical protein ACFX12_016174 [Malus domestica]
MFESTNSLPLPTPVTINAAAQLPLKLTSTNFPSWRAQFNALLLGYDLLGYIDGSKPCLAASSAVSYTFWIRQDQLILKGIVQNVALNFLPLHLRSTTPLSAHQHHLLRCSTRVPLTMSPLTLGTSRTPLPMMVLIILLLVMEHV